MSRCALLLSVALVTFSIAPATAQPKEKDESAAVKRSAASDWRAAIESALQKNVSVKFVEKRLIEVVAYLREQIGGMVLLDRRAVDDVGIAPDTPVTAQFTDMSLRSVLRHLLRPLELTWDLRDGAMVITTPAEAEEQLHTVVYDVVDLVKPTAEATPDEYDYDSLIDLITMTVAPQTWDTVGGPGAIQAFRGSIVLSQTEYVHDQLREMLRIYREAKQLAEKHGESPPPISYVDATQEDSVAARIRRALATPVTLDFSDSPTSDVADFIANQSKINVILDIRALDDEGIALDSPVTFHAKGIELRHALTHILRESDLTYVIRDQALLITTPEESECSLTTRAYPVADLLGKIEDVDMFGDPMRPASHDDLIDIITSTVAPSSWDEVGGSGSIAYCPHIDVLLVSQTRRVHESVADLLAKMRKKLAESKQASPPNDSQREAERTTLVIYHVASATTPPQPAPSTNPTPSGVTGQFGSTPTSCQMSGPVAIIPEGELITVITQLIEPASWTSRDDVYLKAVPGRLIIRHTKAVHRQIGRLLERLGASYRFAPVQPGSGGYGGMGGMF